MSDLLLVVAVVGTFGAVVTASVAMAASARTRRAGQVLQAQLQSAGVGGGPAAAAAKPFGERIVEPLLSGVVAVASRLTPAGTRAKIAKKIEYAGSPHGWTAERFIVGKLLGIVAGLALGALIAPRGLVLGVFWIPLMALIGYSIPGAYLGQAVLNRQTRIRKTLPDTIDLLTISVEAGLSFDAAMLHARRTMRGPLSEELGRMLHEIQLGVPRTDAFRHLSERTDVEELRGFILAMIQADVFGVSIANVLRAQSHELRVKRRQFAEEQAMKTPVKLLFPLILCILPALLVVIMAPGAINIAKTLFGPNSILSR
jgi:tight adherence protein C